MIKKCVWALYFTVCGILLVPCGLLILVSKNKAAIAADLERWMAVSMKKSPATGWSRCLAFVSLMGILPEYRSLVYYRLGFFGNLVKIFLPPLSTLYISSDRIGTGLFIQHGFATIISAKSIGRNCWINQQVTIGFSNPSDRPVLEDNVTVSAGAKVIGKVTVGKNSIIGANAVVVKDVPPDCTVVGVPAYIVKRNGVKVREAL